MPFVSIGADHACEQLNRLMKVHAGLTGISNNPNARQRFFLATPELSCLAKDFKSQFHSAGSQAAVHHDLSPGKVKREHGTITRIKEAIDSHGNPFAVESSAIYNLITHAYIPDEYMPQILNIDDTGQKLYKDYVSEKINGDVSLWAPMKKEKNLVYMSGNKKHTVKVRDKTVDLKETKDLYGRLMVLAGSNRDRRRVHECTLCDDVDMSEDLQLTLAKVVCTAYRPKGIQLWNIPELHWHLFCKYMAESEKLPPILGALKQHILRAHVQARVWGQAAVPQQELLDPLKNGYHRDSDDGQLQPATTDVPPAPEPIVEMVRCQCKGNCSSNRCSCKSKNLPCTDLCLCNTQCENDADTHYNNRESDDDNDG